LDSENRPTPPAESGSGTDASEGGATPGQAGGTPVTPSAKAASTGTTTPPPSAAAQTPGTQAPAERVETPSSTTPAETVSPATGATKTGSTPTPSVSKGVPNAVAATAPGTTTTTAARPAAAKPVTKPAAKPAGAVVQSATEPPVNKLRRRIVWASVAGFFGAMGLMIARFFLPRAIYEPSSIFRIGFPSDYGLGVDTKWQQQYRIWVDKTSDRIFVVYARCTHLGCTPDWKSSENKFKCPCHGSGYDSEGINFEGPAPRPMDRAHVEMDAEGQIVVDINRLYKQPKGERNEFNDPGAYIPLGG
jgi:cytochrome b6-f complex iron-sulfur subunit